jgi:hypothetical protein
MSQRVDLGPPDLQVAGFQLWVHGRQFPESHDYYDGNWLRVTAHCGASGASIWVEGAILMVTDVAGFGDQCAAVLRGESESAVLDPVEPELNVALRVSDRLGHLRAHVEITPDHLAQSHRLEFDLDQSYLPHIITQCATIVQEYPVRGAPGQKGA